MPVTHIIKVEPVSADGMEDPEEQDHVQGRVLKRDALWTFRDQVGLQGV